MAPLKLNQIASSPEWISRSVIFGVHQRAVRRHGDHGVRHDAAWPSQSSRPCATSVNGSLFRNGSMRHSDGSRRALVENLLDRAPRSIRARRRVLFRETSG